jgi:hypothetical protein
LRHKHTFLPGGFNLKIEKKYLFFKELGRTQQDAYPNEGSLTQLGHTSVWDRRNSDVIVRATVVEILLAGMP